MSDYEQDLGPQPTEELYYIQKYGFCGDCLLWWCANRCGYTMNLKEALKVTATEAAAFTRIEDVPWLVSDVDAIAQLHVNSEHLENAKPGINSAGAASLGQISGEVSEVKTAPAGGKE